MKFLSALNNCQTAENGGINIPQKYNWETHLKEEFSAYFYFPRCDFLSLEKNDRWCAMFFFPMLVYIVVFIFDFNGWE